MSAWAKPGVKCICIDDSWGRTGSGKEPLINRGHIYTVANVNGPWLRIVEVRNSFGDPAGYRIDRFRPLVEDSDDEEIEARIYRSKRENKHIKSPRETEVANAG